ncbi:hypothetical protein CMUST_01155 [Corynebacterium mustelae]|uniref:Uncharacterized protein n=1 Tax=Corynebacterium mustelae TaxID=571915 RepID=A0A0G3GTT2_9CORY|nr:hypothetical protein [Corynebacterium mustelae]AKK04581.1 hypothetical protein CMUST_01155 [Corynebacterium mustelae]
MLDRSDVHVLSSCLSFLSKNVFLLDDLLEPVTNLDEERVGRSSPASKAPLVLDVLEVKRRCEIVLFGWAACLAESSGEQVPAGRVVGVVAGWLFDRVGLIVMQEWAPDCLGEIAEVTRRVRGIVIPDEIAEVPSLVSAREASRLCCRAGRRLSHQTVSAWAASGVVTDYRIAGRRLVNVREVYEKAGQRK